MPRVPLHASNALLLAAVVATIAACAQQNHRAGLASVEPRPYSGPSHSNPRGRPCLLGALDCAALATPPPHLCLASTARCPTWAGSYEALVRR
jgi:hypothetical protein